MKSIPNLLFPIIFLISLVSSEKLTEAVFYKADPLVYTVDFCSQVQVNDFLEAIKPETSKEANKPKAFKTLFDACKGRFLHDALMAKQIIIPMVDTENTEYLPLLLDQVDLLDSNDEIENMVNHFFTLNISPSENEYFFQVRNPDRAMAYLLAYTKVSKENLESLRNTMENLKNHPSPGEYSDAKSVNRSIAVLDKYLKSPETVGNRKFLLAAKNEVASGSNWMILAVVLGIGAILAVVLGVLWKYRQVK